MNCRPKYVNETESTQLSIEHFRELRRQSESISRCLDIQLAGFLKTLRPLLPLAGLSVVFNWEHHAIPQKIGDGRNTRNGNLS